MTGRGAGFCAGYGAPGYMTPGFGRGRGFGRGFGRGRGGGWHRGGWGFSRWAPYTPAAAPRPADERLALQQQARDMEAALEDVRSRLAELKQDAGAE
jgi:hypothetical protein